MNIGILTSFIVGGLMLLSVLFFTITFQGQTQEVTLSSMTHDNMNTIVSIITNDMNRLGYLDTSGDPINTMQSKELSFEGDIFDDDTFGVTTVTWEWQKSSRPVSGSTNPNDYWLVRTGPASSSSSSSTIRFPVTYFNVNYYNDQGNTTSTSSTVKRIEIELIVESEEPYYPSGSIKGGEAYYRSVWKKTFFPNNLNKPY